MLPSRCLQMAAMKTILMMAVSLVALFGGVHFWWTPWRHRKPASKPPGSSELTGGGRGLRPIGR